MNIFKYFLFYVWISIIVIASGSNAYADLCSDVLADGTFRSAILKSHYYGKYVLAAELLQ